MRGAGHSMQLAALTDLFSSVPGCRLVSHPPGSLAPSSHQVVAMKAGGW